MNIGDRVRVLHGKEEGVIRKISAGGRIEVEIEDGFVIPVLKSEVVLVAEAEKNHFGEAQSSSSEIETPLPISAPKDQGLYLAFLPINDQNLSLYLINDSRQAYVSHASEVYGTNHRTLYAGTLGAGEAKKNRRSIASRIGRMALFFAALYCNSTEVRKSHPCL